MIIVEKREKTINDNGYTIINVCSYLHPKYVGYVVGFHYSMIIVEERKKKKDS